MKKLIRCILSAAILVSSMLLSAHATSNTSYFYDGIDAYQNPGQVAETLNVNSTIIVTNETEPGLNVPETFDVTIVSTPNELISAVQEDPFAAIIVMDDSKTSDILGTLVDLSDSYHLILMMQTTTLMPFDTSVLSNSGCENPSYAMYYVENGELKVFDFIESDLSSPADFEYYVDRCKGLLLWRYNGEVNCVDSIPDCDPATSINSDMPLWDSRASSNYSSCILISSWGSSVQDYGYIYSNSSGTGSAVRISTGKAVLDLEETVSGQYYDYYKIKYWSGSTLKTGWLQGADAGIADVAPINLRDYDGSPDNTIVETHSGITYRGHRLKNDAGMYDSSGRLIRTIKEGSWVWVSNDALCGSSNPHYFTINAYSPWGGSGETEGPQGFYTVSSYTFINGGFNTSNYNIFTSLDN